MFQTWGRHRSDLQQYKLGLLIVVPPNLPLQFPGAPLSRNTVKFSKTVKIYFNAPQLKLYGKWCRLDLSSLGLPFAGGWAPPWSAGEFPPRGTMVLDSYPRFYGELGSMPGAVYSVLTADTEIPVWVIVTLFFIFLVSIIAKIFINLGISKRWHIHVMEYYSAAKKERSTDMYLRHEWGLKISHRVKEARHERSIFFASG